LHCFQLPDSLVSSRPDLTCLIHQIRTSEVLVSSMLSIPYGIVTFNPANDSALCTLVGQRLLVWEVKLQFQTYFLNSAEL